MRALILSLWGLFLGLALLMLGNGLQGTLLGVRASLEGFDTGLTGAIMTCYYVGYIFGSIVTPRLIARVGHVRVFAAFASLVSFAPLAHSMFVFPLFWALVRVMAGMSMAGIFIIAESWLNNVATNQNRARVLSAYIIVTQLCIAGGQFLLNVANPLGFELFILMSALFSLAVVPITLSRREAPTHVESGTISLAQLIRFIPYTVGALFCVSLTYGAFYGFGAVYALRIGFDSSQIAGFMAAAVLGGVVMQWPLGLLSDKIDRRRVALLSCVVVMFTALLLTLLPPGMPHLAQLLMFVFGGMSLPLYSILLAMAGDFLEPEVLVAACSKMVLVTGVGSALGPVCVALLMENLSVSAFPAFIGIAHVAAAGYMIVSLRVRPPVTPDKEAHFTVVTPQATFIAAEMAGRVANDFPEPIDSNANEVSKAFAR